MLLTGFGGPVHERQDVRLFLFVTERMEISNFFDPTHSVQRIKKMSVLRRELTRFHVTASQIGVLISIARPRFEQVKSEPTSISSRNPLPAADKPPVQQ